MAEEFNNRAKAEGRYLDKEWWEIPLTPGSLLDVSETPESRARIEWLKQQIAELKRQQQEREAAAIKEVTGESAGSVQSLLPEEPAQPFSDPGTSSRR